MQCILCASETQGNVEHAGKLVRIGLERLDAPDPVALPRFDLICDTMTSTSLRCRNLMRRSEWVAAVLELRHAWLVGLAEKLRIAWSANTRDLFRIPQSRRPANKKGWEATYGPRTKTKGLKHAVRRAPDQWRADEFGPCAMNCLGRGAQGKVAFSFVDDHDKLANHSTTCYLCHPRSELEMYLGGVGSKPKPILIGHDCQE